MNQLESIFQKLAKKEADLKALQRQRRLEKMVIKTPRELRPIPTRDVLISRLMSKVMQDNDCWIWIASLNQFGYGSLSFGKETLAHRISFWVFRGDPTGMCVCHHCDNPKCCNPDHLFLGTHSDNMKDMSKKMRHTRHVLSPSDVLEIRRRHKHSEFTPSGNVKPGFHQNIASEFGISQDYARHITAGLNRTDV